MRGASLVTDTSIPLPLPLTTTLVGAPDACFSTFVRASRTTRWIA